MAEYAFDVKLFALIRVEADSEEAARERIRREISGADANLGCWDDGTPIVVEVSTDGDGDLVEIDGEDPDASDETCAECGAHLDGAHEPGCSRWDTF